MEKVRLWLAGKKTNILVILSIAGTIMAWAGGTIELFEAIQLIIAALAGSTVHAAVVRNEKPK